MDSESPTIAPEATSKRPNLAGIAAAIFAAMLWLRLIGIGWGLPNNLHWQSYHPDEPVNILYAQQIELAKGDLDPSFYNYPTLYLTALRVVSDMTAAYTGAADPKSEESTWKFFGRATMGGRILTALAGAGTSAAVFFLVLYALRRRLEGVDLPAIFGAVLGALAIGVAPAFVVHSRFATVDVPSAFFLALALLWSVKLAQAEGGDRLLKLAIVAGVWTGLAAGTKYNAGLVILPVLAAPWLAKLKDAPKLNAASVVVSGLVFLMTTPGILTNSSKFWQDFNYELGHTATGHGLVFIGTPSGFLFHIQNLLGGYGALLLIVSLIALGLAIKAKNQVAILVLLLIVPYYLLIGRAEVKFMRYTFPIMVGLATGLGILMGRAREQGGRQHAWVAAGILAVGGLDPGGLRGASVMTIYMASPDPRDLAGEYLKDKGTVGIVSDPWFWTPALYPNVTLPRMAGPDRIFGSLAENPQVMRYLPADIAARKDWDIRLLEESKPEYVVYSSFEERNLARIAQMSPIPEAYQGLVNDVKAFTEKLQQDYTLDRAYGVGTRLVEDMEYIQPTIWIWKRKAGS